MDRRQFMALMPAAAGLGAAEPSSKPRLSRKDSFFGLHFDLHPVKEDTILGRDVTGAMVGRLLDRVKPDYIQYDSKGHPGWLGWPSAVGPSSPGIVRDSLEIWRRETAQRGVALYIHFSGLWDTIAVEQHPEWARVTPDGKPDNEKTSTFGPYVDERMIPQLREAATKYSVDGAWVDGDCWAAALDYSPAALKAWGKDAPKKPGEPGWLEWLEFNREQFRRYVARYAGELHRTHPHFQLASNWFYSTFAPEKPALPVDYLSGDYLGNAAISSARLEARYLAATGMPWDLLAWGFQWGRYNKVGHIHKPAVQLKQEAGAVLSQGGGFQIYYYLPRGGHIDERTVDTAAEVAEFCRARQKLSHKTESVPQAAVLFSRHSLYTTTNKMFGGWGSDVDSARGVLDALAELHYSVDVLPDWKLESAARYPLIVVPDWEDIGADAHAQLRSYASGGGTLLLLGARNGALFASELGVKILGEEKDQAAFVPGRALMGNATGLWCSVDPSGAGEVIGQRFANFDSTRDSAPAATMRALGKGRIAGIFGPIGRAYAQTHDPSTREFLHSVLERLWTPMVQIGAPPTVEVSLRKSGSKYLLHLLNTTGMQVAGEYAAIDYVPEVGPITISARLPEKRPIAMLEPGATRLDAEWRDERMHFTVPRLHLHSVVVMT
jgi:hypothetical protein